MIFHPIAFLHVIITEAYNRRIQILIKNWKINYKNEKAKIYFLQLKCQANDRDRKIIKQSFRKKYGRNSNQYLAIKHYEILCKERYIIEQHDIYYKSIHNKIL